MSQPDKDRKKHIHEYCVNIKKMRDNAKLSVGPTLFLCIYKLQINSCSSPGRLIGQVQLKFVFLVYIKKGMQGRHIL